MRKNLLVVLVLLFISGLTFYRMLRPGFYPMHDDMQAMRLLQMHKCITDGQIPCRWVPDMGYGYGYPQFNYYAPLPYYVMEIPNLLGFSILSSVKIGFILSVLVGVAGMYLFASSLWGKYAGIVSASFIALIPYRSIDMWARGAMGELWGLAFFPFIFYTIRKAVNKKKNSEVLLAISLACLLTSHNISSLIFIPFALCWAIYLLYQKHGVSPLLYKTNNIKKLFVGFFWGLFLSAFFVVPAWTERGLVHVDSLTGGYFDYRLHFASISQLFTSNYWNFGSSQPGRFDETYLGIGLIHWSVAFLSIVVFIVLKRRKTIKTIAFLFLLAMISVFMAHTKSMLIWSNLSVLKFVQFPWRFLIVSTFLFSVVAGSIVAPLKPSTAKARNITVLLVALVIFFNSGYFRPSTWLNITDSEKFSGDEWLRQQTISIYDYLPKTVQNGPDSPASVEPDILSGEGKVTNIQKGSDWYSFDVDVSSEVAQVQIPIYYFPNWTVEVNGVKQNIDYSKKLGLIVFTLANGTSEVYAKLTDTPIRSISNIISLFATLYVPYHITKTKRKERRT